MDLTDLNNVTVLGDGAKIVCSHDLATGTFYYVELENSKNITFQGITFDYEINNIVGAVGVDAALVLAGTPASANEICENISFYNCRFRIENTSPSNTWEVENINGVSGPLPEGETNYKIEGIYLNGDFSNLWRHKLITVDNCIFDRCTARLFWMWACEDIQFTNNYVNNVGARRPQIRIIVGNKNIKVLNNTFVNNNEYSCETTIHLSRQAVAVNEAINAIVSNNTFYYGRGRSVLITGFKNVIVDSNIFTPNPDYNTALYSNAGLDAVYGVVECGTIDNTGPTQDRNRDIVVSNNTCDGNGLPVMFFNGYSGVTGGTTLNENITVEANSVYNCVTNTYSLGAIIFGITNYYENITVSNNTLLNNDVGIYLQTIKNCSVTNNTISYDYGSGLGIDLADGFKAGLTISGNYLTDLSTAIYATSGTYPVTAYVFVKSVSGTFSGTLTGGTSGATATISSSAATDLFQADQAIVVTSPSGIFREGETVTGSGGGSGIVTVYTNGDAEMTIIDNVFMNMTLGIRNFTTVPKTSFNRFYNCATNINVSGANFANNIT
jgi:parallel beta-helix repeat protein